VIVPWVGLETTRKIFSADNQLVIQFIFPLDVSIWQTFDIKSTFKCSLKIDQAEGDYN
jgi:hypothetical protein